jgi:hypothetical protein
LVTVSWVLKIPGYGVTGKIKVYVMKQSAGHRSAALIAVASGIIGDYLAPESFFDLFAGLQMERAIPGLGIRGSRSGRSGGRFLASRRRL